MNDQRATTLGYLVRWRLPVDQLAAMLSTLEWDAEHEVVILTAGHVQDAIRRFLSGVSSAHEIEQWANLIECREDVGHASEAVKKAIHVLANPVLNGELTKMSAAELAQGLSG